MRNENRPQPAAALAEYRLLRISRAGQKWRIAAPPFPILPRHSRFTPRHSPIYAPPFPILPRHSRESGNPQAPVRVKTGGLRTPLGRPRARLRVFVKTRIHRIGGIFRISFRPARAFRHNRKSSQDEYGQAPAVSKDARRRNPENPIIPRILILARRPPMRNSQKSEFGKRAGRIASDSHSSLLSLLSSLFSLENRSFANFSARILPNAVF